MWASETGLRFSVMGLRQGPQGQVQGQLKTQRNTTISETQAVEDFLIRQGILQGWGGLIKPYSFLLSLTPHSTPSSTETTSPHHPKLLLLLNHQLIFH